MMAAIRTAPLGDEILGEDPTVRQLEELAADILGKEAALFTASGTMSNQIAVMAFTRRGDEIILGAKSHLYNLEAGGLGALSQVQTRPVDFPKGVADPDLLASLIRPSGVQAARTGLICLENAYDLNMGYPVSAENTRDVCAMARRRGIPVYLDGARIFNAAVSLNIGVKDLAREVDAVQICLTKGLGAPFGSLLLGDRPFIEKCKWLKQRLGGGLRQGGIVAAPGIVALTTMIGRLGEDHENALRLARGLNAIEKSLLDPEEVKTNAVSIDIGNTCLKAEELLSRLLDAGIKIKRTGPTNFRLMTHANIGKEEIDLILETMSAIFRQ
jgi:threonine aldolase